MVVIMFIKDLMHRLLSVGEEGGPKGLLGRR
jgi:hypothetical protein